MRAGKHVHRADRQPGAGADADDRSLCIGRIPARNRRGLALRCALRIGLFLGHQPLHDLAQCGQQGGGIGAFGRHADRVAMAQPELQQRDQTFGISSLIARTYLGAGSEAARGLGPARGRARMQPVGVGDGPVEMLGQVSHWRMGGRGRTIAGQRVDDLARIGRSEQALQRGVILDQPGQPAQQGDMGIGLGSDADHQTGDLARIPLHAFRELQHGNAIAAHQVTVFAKPVRNGHAVPEESIRQLLAAAHAGLVARRNAAGGDQHLCHLGDGVGLVVRPRLQADQFPADGGRGGQGLQGGLQEGGAVAYWERSHSSFQCALHKKPIVLWG
ncbi:hypothetical protein D3C73_845280 [compost metagenome]